MDRRTVIGGGEHPFVVLSLCSYGDHGDYQVLPRGALSLDLVLIRDILLGRGFRAAIDGDRLLADPDGCQAVLYESGRAVLESVSPDSSDVAWNIYSSMVAQESPPHPGAV